MLDKAVLIIDQGGQSSRVLVFNQHGRVIASSQKSINTHTPKVAYIEHSPAEVLASIQQCLAEIVPQIQAIDIIAAGLIVQRSSFLAINRQTSTPLSPIISWQDSRNSEWLHQQRLDKQAIHHITGLYANAHYGASKMRWLLDHNPAVQQAAKEQLLLFLPLASYLAKQLCHNQTDYRVDSDIASRTLLFNIFTQQWHDALLAQFNIDKTWLPEPGPDFIADKKAPCLSTFPQTLPLRLVAGDQSFLSQTWQPKPTTDGLFINCGSGAFIQMPLPAHTKPAVDKLLLNHVGSGSDCAFTLLEGTVNAAASALQRLWQIEGQQLNQTQIQQAIKQNNDIPLYLMNHAGVGSPHWLAASEDIFKSSSVQQGALTAKACAVLEAVIFLLMDNIVLLQKVNRQIKEIHIGGGLSNLDGFCQKLADLSQLTVIREAQTEVSAKGAAAFLFRSTDVTLEAVKIDKTTLFTPVLNQPLKMRHQGFQSLITQKKKLRNAL
ncbi:MAG: hypothetical protein HRU20_01765 [Pseudomonadales bacterium]|nr:hypothetical protein [Pseudomonadales bacterium]